MDLAYDHIQEESFKDAATAPTADGQPAPQHTLNEDLQEAYRAISTSAWGSRIGGFLGSVVKQGESVYHEAQKELTAVGNEATRGFSDLRESLISRTRSLSLTTGAPESSSSASATDGAVAASSSREAVVDPEKDKDRSDADNTPTRRSTSTELPTSGPDEPTVLTRLRSEAAKRLRDLQRAEDAADEALLKFGSNIRDFLKDAVSIAPPTTDAAASGQAGGGAGGQQQQSGEVLFESKDAHGKRVIHTSRFDAQLHAVHANADGFLADPPAEGFASWAQGFDVDAKTGDIAACLAKYPELRATMERLVPDRVAYADFWKRYYFLRQGIETAEARRRDLLKAAEAEDEVGWGDDDSDDEAQSSTPAGAKKLSTTAAAGGQDRPASSASSTTIHPPSTTTATTAAAEAMPAITVRPAAGEAPRKSNDEKSQADSDTSYDMVGAASGVPSQAPSSPKGSRKGDESDEDWE